MNKPILIHHTVIPYSDADIKRKPISSTDIPKGKVISAKEFVEKQERLRLEYPPENQTKIFVRSEEEMESAICIEISDDKELLGYVAVSEAGDIISLLKNPNSKRPGFMDIALANAIEAGGNRLDCFDCDLLGPHYCKHGFMPICRIRFSRYVDEYGMAAHYGTPDIIFYIYLGDSIPDYWHKLHTEQYPELEDYINSNNLRVLPFADDIQNFLGNNADDQDYDFAHSFRDMIWLKWNSGLRERFINNPLGLIPYVVSDADRLKRWMKDINNEK